uniref:Uncharacterized protein n=1 Tax=Panagrolaimus superbus TaxID=310955 RepID=A0A914Z9F4_9BILA
MWASWSGCNAVCGTGSKVRSRICQVDVGFGGISEMSTNFQTDTLLSPFQSGIRPIRPQISMRGKRQAWNLPPRPPQTYVTAPTMVDPRCDCVGRSVETEVCTASECPAEPQIDPCSWSEWSPWCGCSGNCQQGIRARTRFCHQEEDATRHRPGRRNFGTCDCPGEKVQTQDCLPTQCSSSGGGAGRSSSSRPRGAVLFAERDLMMPKEKINEIGEFGIITKKKLQKNNQKSDDFIIKDEKDKNFDIFEDEDEVTSCSWSDWSEWTKCGVDFLKQRTRFCVGLKALINNCECRGATMQQTSCQPDRDAHNYKPSSSAVLSVSRDILNEKLSSIDKQQHDEVHSDIPESPKTKIRPLGGSGVPGSTLSDSSTGIKFLSGSDIITASEDLEDSKDSLNCTWSEWQSWGPCDGICGEEGERKRKRECPCKSCNGGITTEIQICKTPPCSFNLNNHKKNPFD